LIRMLAAAAVIFPTPDAAQPVKRAASVSTAFPERRKVISAVEPSSSGQL
jgi:hypothetical protein